MRIFLLFIVLFLAVPAVAQTDSSGILTGNVLDEKGKALEGATVQLISFADTAAVWSTLTDKNGYFSFQRLLFGYYKLRFSFVGFQALTIDSLHFRPERFDFSLNDVTLKAKNDKTLDEVIVYAEKPLIQSKDGNITYNAGESPLSAGSSANELLTNVPLVTKDPSGKLLVRGKEPRILIDDKPVELNQQQLQDLLESLPGSAIEKIEVMTNPPPQYATEQGGVINIVTRKGRVGKGGRISVSAGTRGEGSVNGNFNYRKQGFALNVNAGVGYNQFDGEGYSFRQNFYADSTNFFRTNSLTDNRNLRPNLRANLDYDVTKNHAVNFVLQYNQNDFDNENNTTFRNLNRFQETYRLSNRRINSVGDNYNTNLHFTYTWRTKRAGEVLKLFTNANFSRNESDRLFYQQFFYPDYTSTGVDSTQQQINSNKTKGYNLRLQYDLPLKNKKTFFSFGSFYNRSHSDVDVVATYKNRSDGKMLPLPQLSNNFRFRQRILNGRASVKQILSQNFSVSAGITAEVTDIRFDLCHTGTDTTNRYANLLPFFNINRNWKDVLNLTFSYRRTIRRPGIGELNPTVDFSDPYNIRFGNPDLEASLAHNFDLVLGKTKTGLYANLGLGYNAVEDIFSQIRTLLPDGKTQITWQNISRRKEYEVSTWSGYTLSKKTKVNFSAGYTYNRYGDYDRQVRKFRNGGSLTANLNTNYHWSDLYTATGSFTYNRFANPQGTVRGNLSMNVGLQAKTLEKKLTVTLNVIDPFAQQQNRAFTFGTNFTVENFSTTQTRNLRLTVGYNFTQASPKGKVNRLKS